MPSPRDVIVAALATPLDGSIEERAQLIEAALIEHACLPNPDAPASPVDVDRAARWLAERSLFPRYTPDMGGEWRKVLESARDVETAYAYAARNASQSDADALMGVKSLLLSAVAARRACRAVT